MARTRTDLTPQAQAIFDAMAARRSPAQDIVNAIKAAGQPAPSRATIAARLLERRAPVSPARAVATKPSVPLLAPRLEVAKGEVPIEPEVPATAADRQIDELIARSLVWRKIETALAGALAPYPDAANAAIRALRAVTL